MKKQLQTNILTGEFEDFLPLLQKNGVKFLGCGGRAGGVYGYL